MTAIPLRDRFDAAEPFTTAHPAQPPTVRATPYVWRDPAMIPLRSWVYGRQLLRGSVSVIVAPGATGKTALMTGTALCLATGRDLLGKRVWDGPKRVWLWNLEDSGEELARGIQAAALHWQLTADDLSDRLYVDSGLDGADLKVAVDGPDGCRINAPVVEALVEELTGRAIDVLVVDPFVSSHGVSENDNGAIDAIAKEWARVAVRANCSIVLVHHARKLAGAEVSAEAARGASALIAAARSVVTLNRMSDEEGQRFGIEGEERRRFFRTYDDKNNRAPPAEESDWYRLASVQLGNGDNGGDSLPVVVPWSPPDAFEGVALAHLRAVQDLLAGGVYRKDVQARPWAGEAVAQVLGLDLDRAADKARARAMLKTWEANGALRCEMKPDAKSNPRPFLVPGTMVEMGVSPPPRGEVRNGGEVRTSHLPTTTPLYRGGGGGEGGNRRGGSGGETDPARWHDNPAMGRRGPILAPGETGDEPIPGCDDDK